MRAAVDERREPPPFLLELLEDPAVPDLPHHAVACVLAHDDVWSLDDALAAATSAAGVERLRAAWEKAIADTVSERLEPVHLDRIRTLADRLARLLPFDGLPRASALLARGCELVARDDDVAVDVAVSLLANYVVYLTGPPTLRVAN